MWTLRTDESDRRPRLVSVKDHAPAVHGLSPAPDILFSLTYKIWDFVKRADDLATAHVCIHVCMHVCIHVCAMCMHKCCVYMFTCMHVYTCVCMCTHEHCVPVCASVYAFTCACTCVHVCICSISRGRLFKGFLKT